MADLTFRPRAESTATPRAGTKVDFDGDNTPRIRAVADEKTDYNVVMLLTKTELATFDTFYATNRLLTWGLKWEDNVIVNVKFGAGKPRRTLLPGARLYRVEFTAHGV